MPLHYRPADGFVGDVIPYFAQGAYHLYYLRRRGEEPLAWAHIVSSDLTRWEELPDALAPGGEGSADAGGCWTGSVIGGPRAYHMFYTGYVAQAQTPQTVCRATSPDLVTWRKDDRSPLLAPDRRWYEPTDWRDPFVFWHEEERCYWMLITARVKDAPTSRAGCIALAKSADLDRWEVGPPLWTPYIVHAPECPDMFPLGPRWYMLFSTAETRYRVGHAPAGPWAAPAAESLDGPRFYAAKTLADENRRLLFGWVPTRKGASDAGAWEWGGDLALPRQIEPDEDGALFVRCPSEVAEAFGAPVLGADEITAFQGRLGQWRAADDHLVGQSRDGFAYAVWPEGRRNLALVVRIALDAPPTRAGLLLRTDDDLQRGYVLMLEPLFQRITLRPWQSWGDGEPFVERPVRLSRGEPVLLQVAMEGSIIEVLINHRACLTGRIYDHPRGNLGFFVENGTAEFSALTAWALPEE